MLAWCLVLISCSLQTTGQVHYKCTAYRGWIKQLCICSEQSACNEYAKQPLPQVLYHIMVRVKEAITMKCAEAGLNICITVPSKVHAHAHPLRPYVVLVTWLPHNVKKVIKRKCLIWSTELNYIIWIVTLSNQYAITSHHCMK